MASICYFLTYIFETLISIMYFSQKSERKYSNIYILMGAIASVVVQFALSLSGIHYLNLLAFVFCNFLFCILLYKTTILQSLFNVLVLSSAMLITELCVFYISRFVFGISISEHTNNNLTLWMQMASSKLLYFLVAYLIAKLSTKENRNRKKFHKSISLILLPLASISILLGIVRITELFTLPNSVFLILSIATFMLLYSNFIVFWVHESTIKTEKENMEYKLQTQKAELDIEYYTILQNQYENSNILIHDIKRHLLSIKELANQNDCTSINTYIDNLYDEYQIKYLKKYSNHRIINAIINRYMTLCKDVDIDFYCDVRDIDFSFISDANLTSILDNLLENAFEATKNSKNKTIELSIRKTNVNFVVIQLENSCSQSPKLKKGELQTTKANKDIHGYGIKSIKRITKDYDGMINYSYDPEMMIFTFTVVLNASK